MRNSAIAFLRICTFVLAFVCVVGASIYVGANLKCWISDVLPPDIGNPSTDPRGRGVQNAADVIGLGYFFSLILGLIGGWVAVLLTYREYRSFRMGITCVAFIILAIISGANYSSWDTVFTRDAQAVLNFALFSSGAFMAMTLQTRLAMIDDMIAKVILSAALTFVIYAFVAIPLWYSISYVSWKMGAGKLDSLDAVAKVVAAATSVVAILGLNSIGLKQAK